jgi:opacity protein-like surface antigen
MKLKLLFSVVCVCTLLTTSYAQINKGSIWLGSNFSYSQSKDRPQQQPIDREVRTISILPSFGVAIKDNLVLGIFGNYTNAQRENDAYIVERKEKTYGGGLFVRRYVPMFNRFYIWGEGRLGYNAFESKEHWAYGTVTSSNKMKGWETGVTFTPGISYGITQNILLEAGFASLFDARYKSIKSDFAPNSYSIKQKSFNAGVQLENVSALSIGVRFLLNKKA